MSTHDITKPAFPNEHATRTLAGWVKTFVQVPVIAVGGVCSSRPFLDQVCVIMPFYLVSVCTERMHCRIYICVSIVYMFIYILHSPQKHANKNIQCYHDNYILAQATRMNQSTFIRQITYIYMCVFYYRTLNTLIYIVHSTVTRSASSGQCS